MHLFPFVVPAHTPEQVLGPARGMVTAYSDEMAELSVKVLRLNGYRTVLKDMGDKIEVRYERSPVS